MMKLLFVADPIETFKPSKDSTLAMMVAAQNAGHQIYHAKASGLSWLIKTNHRGLRLSQSRVCY